MMDGKTTKQPWLLPAVAWSCGASSPEDFRANRIAYAACREPLVPCSCKYAEHYLAGFAYRFNRRFDLRGLVASLIVDVVRAKPIKEKTVRSHAEARF